MTATIASQEGRQPGGGSAELHRPGARRRLLPSVDQVVRAVLAGSPRAAAGAPPTAPSAVASPYGQRSIARAAVVQAAREALASLRGALSSAAPPGPVDASTTAGGQADLVPAVTRESLLAEAVATTRRLLARPFRPSLRRVINATGVVLHTNLGRARLAPEAILAAATAGGYVNLEFSLDDGSRRSRQDHLRPLLTGLTGAEDALVVNNNAAAVWLALRGLARGRAVVISRGELVEIGESFRLPEIMAEAGVSLVEVGTTNRTTIDDYRRALGQAAAVVIVHPSNYRVAGFTARPDRREIVGLAREVGVPVLEDLGSGALLDLGPWGLEGEPTPREAIAAGVDLVTFSGDKLLGGPQAGVVAGRSELVARLRRDPLLRCLRPDKMTLAALEATLRLYGDPVAEPETALARVPVLAALTEPAGAVRRRAARALRLLRRHQALEPTLEVALVAGQAEAGGGSLPGVSLPTWALRLVHPTSSAEALWSRLAAGDPPVIARRHGGAVLLDFRSVADEEIPELVKAVAEAAVLKEGEEVTP